MDQPETMIMSRRAMLLAAACMTMFLPLFAHRAAVAGEGACVDLDTLPADQRSMRRSLGFRRQSSDPDRRCGRCAFFMASAGDCGTCTLLSGGIVVNGSVCDSWTQKP